MSDNGHERQTFTVAAALDYLKRHGVEISVRTLYRWIEKGDVTVIRPTPTSRNIKIDRTELDMLLTPR